MTPARFVLFMRLDILFRASPAMTSGRTGCILLIFLSIHCTVHEIRSISRSSWTLTVRFCGAPLKDNQIGLAVAERLRGKPFDEARTLARRFDRAVGLLGRC